MKKRDYFDFSDLLGQSTEVFGETLRRAFDYDAYGGKRKFPAIVLTPPVPMTAGQAGLFTRANRPGTPIKGEKLFAGPDAAINKLDKFFFRGRIIGPNSPHAFLPDPCQYQASDTAPPDTVFKLMSMHTLFVSSEDYQLGSGDVFPSKGSVVLVELDENQFGYNLEVGRLVSVLTKTNTYHNVENMVGSGCSDMLASGDWSGLTIEELTEEQLKQGAGNIGYPTVSNYVTSKYGPRNHPNGGERKMHYGTDYRARRGDPIYSIANGTIERIFSGCVEGDGGCGKGWGNHVIVKHSDGFKSVYAHLSRSAKIKVGQKVTAGDVVGQGGATGGFAGMAPHLHLVVYNKEGKKINPAKYIDRRMAQKATT
jgi:hypothetical protein